MEGQLWPKERELLYKTVKELRPLLALEIGTWKGGGSTYQIANALMTCGGRLITCEPDIEMFTIAQNTYETELSGNMPVTLINDYSYNVIAQLINDGIIIDFVFMDGPEDPKNNLQDLQALENVMRTNSLIAFHDWDLELRPDGGTSIKNTLTRPYMEDSLLWELQAQLTAPSSVGFSVWRRR